jgi:hypothetical protein
VSYAGDDLVPLLIPTESNALTFRQGVIVTYSQTDGSNTVQVGGSVMSNLPILNTSEALLMTPGAVVGLLSVGTASKTMFILGRITIPGTPDALTALSAFRTITGTVAAAQGTTSTSYTDLTTAGPTVQVTVPNSGRVLMILSARIGWSDSDPSSGGAMSAALSGANTVAAGGDKVLSSFLSTATGGAQNAFFRSSVVHVYEGLTPGLTTWTAKYQTLDAGEAADFEDRTIVLIPL